MSEKKKNEGKEGLIPTSKIGRASKFLKTGLNVGKNYLKHYGKKMLNQEVSQDDLDRENAEDILKGFSELRGAALKVAQMMSMDSINFSATFTDIMSKAQYSVPPMSGPMAVRVFKRSTGKDPEEVFDKFNPKAARAASMGQVHEAWLNGKKLAVKIQYPGVAESIESDLKLVKSLATKLMKMSSQELVPYFEEIYQKLKEEADYELELRVSMEFRELCKDLENIVFPQYYPELSSDKVIVMDWLEGMHLKEFLKTNPSYDLRLKVAKNLWNFYEYQIHVLRQVNADPHPGNFLIQQDGTIGVIDFGCTKKLDDELYHDYFGLANPKLYEDEQLLEKVLRRIEILRPTDSAEKAAHVKEIFLQLIKLIAKPYHVEEFDFTDESYYQALRDVSAEITKLRELRGKKDFLFLNKTLYGLYTYFQELGVKFDARSRYVDVRELMPLGA